MDNYLIKCILDKSHVMSPEKKEHIIVSLPLCNNNIPWPSKSPGGGGGGGGSLGSDDPPPPSPSR